MSRTPRCALRASAALAALGLALPAPVSPQEIVRRVGRVTIRVDASRAFPGGVVVARLSSTARLGAAWALLDGRRAPFYADRGVLRALVPVAADSEPGPATLGVAIAARRGEQHVAIPVEIVARVYATRAVELTEAVRLAMRQGQVLRDARRLLAFVRTESAAPPAGRLVSPINASGGGFGELRGNAASSGLENGIDALGGGRHRGIDYPVAVGSLVRSPGAGRVLHAGPLGLSGGAVVIDHGQGVVSVLQHLSREDVRAGDPVAAGDPVGVSGQTGAAGAPLLQWRVYLHGVAVDPLVLAAVLG